VCLLLTSRATGYSRWCALVARVTQCCKRCHTHSHTHRTILQVLGTPARKTGLMYGLILLSDGRQYARFWKTEAAMRATVSDTVCTDSAQPCRMFGDMDVSIGADPRVYCTVRATPDALISLQRAGLDGVDGRLDASTPCCPFLSGILTVKQPGGAETKAYTFPRVPKISASGELKCQFGKYAVAQERLDFFLVLAHQVALIKVKEPPMVFQPTFAMLAAGLGGGGSEGRAQYTNSAAGSMVARTS